MRLERQCQVRRKALGEAAVRPIREVDGDGTAAGHERTAYQLDVWNECSVSDGCKIGSVTPANVPYPPMTTDHVPVDTLKH
jgi:hypothetical protein